MGCGNSGPFNPSHRIAGIRLLSCKDVTLLTEKPEHLLAFDQAKPRNKQKRASFRGRYIILSVSRGIPLTALKQSEVAASISRDRRGSLSGVQHCPRAALQKHQRGQRGWQPCPIFAAF